MTGNGNFEDKRKIENESRRECKGLRQRRRESKGVHEKIEVKVGKA